jgi:hypothetical protein
MNANPLSLDPTERLARKLARLNATTVKFDIGAGGGRPGLSPQDTAAALGMIPAGLGLELLLAVHWPDAAKRNRAKLLELMTVEQLCEHNRREQAMYRALCQVATADARDRARVTTNYSTAHAARWPTMVISHDPIKLAEPYGHIRLAVIEELTHPRQCPVCGGRDLRDRTGNLKTCERCLGQGTVAYGPTWRSKRLGMDGRSGFTRWQDTYQWMLDLARDELSTAELLLLKALR